MLLKYLMPFLFMFDSDLSTVKSQSQPVEQLLMSRQWVMTDYGFDENLNGILDANESRIEDCERDDTYEFYKGGMGLAKSNSFSCCNGLDEQQFRWQLTDNGTSLLLFSEIHSIMRLTTQELITYKKLSYLKGQLIGLITIYKARN